MRFITLLIVQFVFTGPLAFAETPDLKELAWLAGSWKSNSREIQEEIQFMPPAGGVILGASRMVAGERLLFGELIRIVSKDDTLYLNPNPLGLLDLGKVGVFFRIDPKRSTAETLFFENPTNRPGPGQNASTVPVEIIYEHKDQNTLIVHAKNAANQELPG
jgi:hypothetical protein